MVDKPLLKPAMLPSSENISFPKSSFFLQNPQNSLPSPFKVRSKSTETRKKGYLTRRPPPVSFPELNLMVKFGRDITIAEGQCLWAIRHILQGDISVAVPEIFGWRRDNDEVFLYMELVQGDTLEQRWDELNSAEKSSVCNQIHDMMQSLRRLKQDPDDQFIGSIGRQPLLDIIFVDSCTPPKHHFKSLSEFHDWFTTLKRRDGLIGPHPNRSWLPDNVPIVFTHSDLHRSNIIISRKMDGAPRLLSIIDWHQSGWYPAYWEFCKARWSAKYGEDWEKDFLPQILEPCLCYDEWDYFVLRLGV